MNVCMNVCMYVCMYVSTINIELLAKSIICFLTLGLIHSKNL